MKAREGTSWSRWHLMIRDAGQSESSVKWLLRSGDMHVTIVYSTPTGISTSINPYHLVLSYLSRTLALLRTSFIGPLDLVVRMASTVSGTTFANSNSSFRASQSHATPSYSYSDDPSTQLPSVDFNFEDLRQRMAAFTVKFDAFIEKGRKRVLEDRNEFRGRLSELGGMYTFPSVRSRNTRGLPETGSRQALADPAAWAYFDDRHRTLDLEQLDSTQAAQHNLKHHKANEMQSSSARQPGSVTTHD
jgi:hypothetical protein